MKPENEQILKRLTDSKARKTDKKKAELAAELKFQDEILTAYWDGVYDAIKEIEASELWEKTHD